MKLEYGKEILYCVAEVNQYGEKFEVVFGAYSPNCMGMHWTSDWNDPEIVWYETEKEAKSHARNAEDCVLSKIIYHHD